MRHTLAALIACLFALIAGCGDAPATPPAPGAPPAAAGVTIGFLVKIPDEPWFQSEWRHAEQAARELNFTLVKIGARNGREVMAGIDTLAAKGAQGFIICTPDVKLGPAIVDAATTKNLKVFSVDDRFVGVDGKPLATHYMGISARNIGRLVGRTLADEMKVRGWNADETGLCALTNDELETARERVDGAIEALTAAGFPAARVFRTPQKGTETSSGFNAANTALTQQGAVKRWLVCGLNDATVLGGVNAIAGRGFAANDIIGVGINGDAGLEELKKPEATGFFATVKLDPRRHGYETATLMHAWITKGVEPPRETFTEGRLLTRANWQQVIAEMER